MKLLAFSHEARIYILGCLCYVIKSIFQDSRVSKMIRKNEFLRATSVIIKVYCIYKKSEATRIRVNTNTRYCYLNNFCYEQLIVMNVCSCTAEISHISICCANPTLLRDR